MADLFAMTVPLLIRFPDGRRDVMVDYLPHAGGMVYFRPFWDRLEHAEGLQFVRGELRGDGPWKVGDAVVTVLGCHGSNPEEAAAFAEWQVYRQQLGAQYPDRPQLQRIAAAAGYFDSES